MIMGGPIKGGDIFGDYPSLSLTSPLNLSSRGLLLPTTSVDEFYAEIALWFGVSPNDLSYILPNICNFIHPMHARHRCPVVTCPLECFHNQSRKEMKRIIIALNILIAFQLQAQQPCGNARANYMASIQRSL